MGEETRITEKREVKKEKTGKELHERAVDGLESLELDIGKIKKDSLPRRMEIFWMEAEERIGLLKEASQKLVKEGIELRRKGNIEEGKNRILEGHLALTTGMELRREIIESMQKADIPKEEIRAQKRKLVEDMGNSFYLHLKAEILGDMTELRKQRRATRRNLLNLEKALLESGEEKEKVSEKWLEQVKIWKKELGKQKKEMERRVDF